MGETKEKNRSLSISYKIKVTAIEMALEKSLSMFKDLATEFEQLLLESKFFKSQLLTQKEMCDSKTCRSSIELKKDIKTKDLIIQSVASSLTQLNETKNLDTISDILKCICGDVNVLTPPKDNAPNIDKVEVENILVSPKQEESPIYESTFQDGSVSEIDATPTSRRSPIIFSKKMKSNSSNMLNIRDKKKCPDDWSTPEKKNIKLTYPTPTRNKSSGRLRQARLNLVKVKTSNVVDLTSSPECLEKKCAVKKEVVDDETILPSPTSGPIQFQPIHKSILKDSPSKFKIPLVTMQHEGRWDGGKDQVNGAGKLDVHSPSKVNPNRISSLAQAEKHDPESPSPVNESISLLQHVKMFENKKPALSLHKPSPSPSKRPLKENQNIVNVERAYDAGSSLAVLRVNQLATKKPAEDTSSRRVNPENREPVYKEPTVRKKAEKRALPGWSCEQCKIFYDELYRDSPEMLARLMDECSRHRGRADPARPATPPGFWHPRWDVPDDTDEFNRRNDAL